MNRNARFCTGSTSTQRGAVLVVSLMFLLVLTLIGLSGLQVTALEERMSGNARDRVLAFQAAEAALSAGEAGLGATVLGVSNCQSGRYLFRDANCDGTREATELWAAGWGGVLTLAHATWPALSSVSSSPVWVVEELPPASDPCGSLTANAPPKTCIYRVTARGTGGSPDAVVITQSLFNVCSCGG